MKRPIEKVPEALPAEITIDSLGQALGERLYEFSQFLASMGITTGPAALVSANQLVTLGYAENQLLFRSGLKTCFCQNREGWERFDHLFDLFWFSQRGNSQHDELDGGNPEQNDAPATSAIANSNLVGFAGTSSQQFDQNLAGAGDYKALSLADFRFVFNPQEMAIIERLVEDLARRSRQSFLRRKVRSKHGSQIDMRKTLASTVPYNGQVLELTYLKRQRRLPRFVLLLDVSQSMEVYAKLFLRFASKILSVFQQSEVFAFNTELMALGSGHTCFSERDFEERLNARERQWLGGTRIAYSLECFNRDYAPDSVNRHTTVVIFSDGCDTAEPDELAAQVRPIRQRAKNLVWVNPLLGRFKEGEKDPYMDPVVAFVDRYRSAHNLASLELLKNDLLR